MAKQRSSWAKNYWQSESVFSDKTGCYGRPKWAFKQIAYRGSTRNSTSRWLESVMYVCNKDLGFEYYIKLINISALYTIRKLKLKTKKKKNWRPRADVVQQFWSRFNQYIPQLTLLIIYASLFIVCANE